jgi:hypothetical protein
MLCTDDIATIALARYLTRVLVAFCSGGEVVGYPSDREKHRLRIEDDDGEQRMTTENRG